MLDFSYLNIEEAFENIKNKVIKTPLVTSEFINNLLGSKVYFKLENLQKTGSFKLRGATNKIKKLANNNKLNGLVAYSSGNHAQAVAFAALNANIHAKIIMPNNAPKIKINNTRQFGADVILYDPKTQIREEIGKEIALAENRTLIKPYDDLDIIAGQGTAGYEIVNDLEDLSIVPNIYLCCCGGGGLIAGTSTYLKYKFPEIASYAVEPYGFDDTKISLENKKIISNKPGFDSICDAIITPKPGEITFPINLENLSGGIVVKDEEVKNTIKILAEHLKIIVEPGGAVAATALLTKKIEVKDKIIVVMISGGNIDFSLFSRL